MGSALGSALSMTSSTSWNDVVNKIKGVATKTSGNQSIDTSGKWGFDTKYGPWVYIPTNAYYTTSHWLNIPWNTIKGSLGTAGTGNVLTGHSFTSQNGIKLSGSMRNYSSAIQTATTSATDQTKSCYRLNGSYIEVVPAIGYWGTWNWSASCIKVPDRYSIGYNAGKNDKVSNLSVAQEQNSTATTNSNKQSSFTVAANTGKHYVITSIMSRANSSANVFLHTASTTNGSITQFQQLLSNSTTCVKTWHLVKSNTAAPSTVTFTAGRSDAWSAFFCVKLT